MIPASMPAAHRNVRLLTAALFAAFIIPRLMDPGMFVDGVTYAVLARNLAQGPGSFWTPFYTSTVYPEFHEQPPLGVWIESLWFRVLGDHQFVERLYSVIVAATTVLIIVAIWRRWHRGHPAREADWLPIACWVASPIVSWVIVNNLLENTLAVFAAAAVAVLVYASSRPRPLEDTGGVAPDITAGIVSALCVVAGVLTKGPVGLFPLAAPLIILLLIRRDAGVWRMLAAQWTTAAACALVLFLMPASRESLTAYANQALIPAVGGNRETSPSAFTILKELMQGVLLPIAVVAALVVAAARRWTSPPQNDRGWATAFLLIGLSGTLPIVFSRKQTGHYLMPSVAFFALAAAGFLAPAALAAVDRTAMLARTRTMMAAAVALVAIGIAAGSVHWLARDVTTMTALDAMEPVVPVGATIGICPDAAAEWGLHGWFQRRFQASLDADPTRRHTLFLSIPNHAACIQSVCAPISNSDMQLVLLRCG